MKNLRTRGRGVLFCALVASALSLTACTQTKAVVPDSTVQACHAVDLIFTTVAGPPPVNAGQLNNEFRQAVNLGVKASDETLHETAMQLRNDWVSNFHAANSEVEKMAERCQSIGFTPRRA